MISFIADPSEDNGDETEESMGLCRNLLSLLLFILTSTEQGKAVWNGTQKLWTGFHDSELDI